MSAIPAAAKPELRRKKHYVDRSIQGSLLAGLVTLEVVLVAVSAWMMHWHLDTLIEERIYRVHLPETVPLLAQLLQEALGVLGVFALVNLVALILAEMIWSRHENAILNEFTLLVGKTVALDFSSDAAPSRQHEVLALAQAWRTVERARLTELRAHMLKLDTMVSEKYAPQDLLVVVEAMQRILPRAGDSAD